MATRRKTSLTWGKTQKHGAQENSAKPRSGTRRRTRDEMSAIPQRVVAKDPNRDDPFQTLHRLLGQHPNPVQPSIVPQGHVFGRSRSEEKMELRMNALRDAKRVCYERRAMDNY